MKKGLLSQEDYGCKMRGIMFITDHWSCIFFIMPFHEQKKRTVLFVDGSYLPIYGRPGNCPHTTM